MLVDLILDRKDGEPYEPKRFYDEVTDYLDVFPSYIGVARALDCGTNNDVIRELCLYIDREEYNPAIKDYIRSVKWV